MSVTPLHPSEVVASKHNHNRGRGGGDGPVRERTQEGKPMEGLKDSVAEEFWRLNPKGISVAALFGTQGGLGEVGQAIAKLDSSGDGYLSKEEFRTGIREALQAKANVKTLTYVAIFLSIAICVLVGVLAGTMFAIVDGAKDSILDSIAVSCVRSVHQG